MYRIWFERPLPAQYHALLDDIAIPVSWDKTSSVTLASTLVGVDAIVASSRIRYDGAFMDQVPTLRVISRTGIGVDNISIQDATDRGIAVCNSPDGPSASTSEHAILLMLACMKHLNRWSKVLALGESHDYFNEYQGMQAEGLRLGVVGLGRIGRRVAKIAQSLGMEVLGYDPYVSRESAVEWGVALYDSLDAMLPLADVVSLHLPINESTYRLFNKERLALMKRGAVLVNTARGQLVDEHALLNALETGHLSGAGLDVFDPEPPLSSNPLLHLDCVIATPHIGGVTIASKDRLWREAIGQALQLLRGERPLNLVNAEVWHQLKRS